VHAVAEGPDSEGKVTVKLYPGMGHEVNADELDNVRQLMAALPRRDQVGKTANR